MSKGGLGRGRINKSKFIDLENMLHGLGLHEIEGLGLKLEAN